MEAEPGSEGGARQRKRSVHGGFKPANQYPLGCERAGFVLVKEAGGKLLPPVTFG